MTTQKFKIVFIIYDGTTQLDFTGPIQFLSRTPNAETIIASPNGGDVQTDCLTIANTVKLDAIDTCDLICVPGGFAATEMANNDAFIAQVKRLGNTAQYVTSVCTGALILGAAGFLKEKKATTHWAWHNALEFFGAIPKHERVVRDGNVFTGGGVTAGIDFALTVMTELAGEEYAKALQLGLEYDPAPPYNSGSPSTASSATLNISQARLSPIWEENIPILKEAAAKLN